MKIKILLIGLIGIFLLSGCATFGPPASQHETFVYSYEEAGFHLQMAKEIITSPGILTPEQYVKAKAVYNEAVDIYQSAGNAYKDYLRAPDIPTAVTFRQKYRSLMLELTKLILKVNTELKGGQ